MGEISRRTAITAAAVAAAPIVAAAGRGLEDWFDWFPFFRDEPAEPDGTRTRRRQAIDAGALGDRAGALVRAERDPLAGDDAAPR